MWPCGGSGQRVVCWWCFEDARMASAPNNMHIAQTWSTACRCHNVISADSASDDLASRCEDGQVEEVEMQRRPSEGEAIAGQS
jgi:hypothetical protein